jgi:hypothetical protein
MLGARDVSESDTGWYTDEFQGETVHGVTLNFSRGKRRVYLAGCVNSAGEGITVDRYIHDNMEDANRAAESMAEADAEEQREHNRKYQLEHDIDELRDRLPEVRETIRTLIKGLRGAPVGTLYQAIKISLERELDSMQTIREEIAFKREEI